MSDRSNRTTRRQILALGAVSAAGILTGGLRLRADDKAPHPKLPIGLQLYSVRRECGKDGGKNLPKVIEAVARMGYQGVEFAGYYGYSAKDLAKILSDNGIKCCGTHTGIETLLGDQLEKTIEFNKTIGNEFLIVPILRGAYTKDAEAWKKTAGLFNELAAKLKPQGMYCGYHSHAPDFKPVGNTTPWEIFFDNTDKRVVMQVDTCNCMRGKGDPVAMLKKYPGRALTLHCKEYGGKGEDLIGQGKVDWKQVLSLARTTAGTKWLIIEHERGGDALASVSKCLTNLKKMI